MERENIAIGLDIGITKIVLIVGSEDKYKKIKILSKGEVKSDGINRGVVENIGSVMQSVEKAIKQAKETYDFDVKDVVVGIAGKHIKSCYYSDYINRDKFSKLIDEQDVKQLKKQVSNTLPLNHDEKIIDILPQEYKVDSIVNIQPLGMKGKRFEANFHVIIGKISNIEDIKYCVRESNLNPDIITLESLASSDSVLSEDEMEAGVALVDMGGGTTDLAIFKDGLIRYTFTVPIGGASITEDIKLGCEILGKQAEKLKVEFGSAWPNEELSNLLASVPFPGHELNGRSPKEISLFTLSQIISARVAEIIQMIYEQIQIYQNADTKNKLIAGIVLTGGGSQIKDIKQLVENITGMDARIGNPNQHLAEGSKQGFTSPIYATAIGLLKKGIEINQQKQVRSIRRNKDIQEATVVEKKIEECTKKEKQKNIMGKGKYWIQKKMGEFKELLNNIE